MIRILARPKTLVFTLLFLSAIPVGMAAVRLYQIPMGQLPLDAIKFDIVPWSHFAHALGGVLFVDEAYSLKHEGSKGKNKK